MGGISLTGGGKKHGASRGPGATGGGGWKTRRSPRFFRCASGLVAGPCLSEERLGWQGRRSGAAGFPKVAWELRSGGRGRG